MNKVRTMYTLPLIGKHHDSFLDTCNESQKLSFFFLLKKLLRFGCPFICNTVDEEVYIEFPNPFTSDELHHFQIATDMCHPSYKNITEAFTVILFRTEVILDSIIQVIIAKTTRNHNNGSTNGYIDNPEELTPINVRNQNEN